ncbi:hypothetical protein HHI36_009561 [Cryptolaemus montrouzieri]|uniref:Sphingomyelin phosphodiesterase n=1 Tax=Cryptolaemus montrouzieri TaxID=559131 RepID=A0ABD2MG63_9CUCU
MNYSVLLALSLAFFGADSNYSGKDRERVFKKLFTTKNGSQSLANAQQIKFPLNDECGVCDNLAIAILESRRKHVPVFFLDQFILGICVDLKIQDKHVCDGVLDPLLDVLFHIIDNNKNITAQKICSLLLSPTCHNQFDYFNWTIDIPEKPKEIPQKIKGEGTQPLRILQITDIHYDPRYTPGGKAICNEPLCCQDDQGYPSDPDQTCGVWGDYRAADTPRRTLDEALRHMKTQNVDYVYFTGDIISHRIWSTSIANNSKTEREIMELIKNNFDVPVFFVLGNHEPHPINLYAPLEITEEKFSTEWLFNQLSDELRGLVPDEELSNINAGGFYTLLLKPGFRIIVLNNNICLTEDLWLLFDDYDLYGQLTWLTKVLEKAEENGEHVHILQHVPTGDALCLGTWGREFNRIVNRFSDTITGHFNGHTHFDEFLVYFNESEPTEAINVAFNGASLVTFTDNNPSYKIYDIDANTFEVLNFEEWTFNLTSANLQPDKSTVDWYKLYSFKEAYGLPSLKPEEIGNLVIEMAKNRTVLEMYNRYRYRMGDGINTVCDDNCHKSNLCTIVTSSLADTQHCEDIKKIYDEYNH